MNESSVKRFKRPESVLVIVYTRQNEVLLLKRNRPPVGWWQSVTGSLRWDESPEEAAVREVREETGLEVDNLIVNTGVVNYFKIVPESLHLYPTGAFENKEHVFTAMLQAMVGIHLNAAEHSHSMWLPALQAAEKTQSSTNRAAILKLVRPKAP